MSFAGTVDDTFQRNALIYASQHGLVLVASAGNYGTNASRYYPAALPYVIGVANTDMFDLRNSDSNFGTWVDITAPGRDTYSSTWDGGYGFFGGTSASAPEVAASAALVMSAKPSMQTGNNNTQIGVQAILQAGADSLLNEPTWVQGQLGAGRLNMYNSVCLVIDCRPDIWITGLAIDSVPAPRAGKLATVRFTMNNDGVLSLDVPYAIVFGDGYSTGTTTVPAGSSTEVVLQHNYTIDGNYMISAAADWNSTINERNETNNNVSIQAAIQNVAPILRTPVAGTVYAIAGRSITLNARASDANADVISYSWYLDTGSGWQLKGNSSSQAFILPAGRFRAKAMASDGQQSSEAIVNLVVNPAPVNQKPPEEKPMLV
jgi:hypothetical protein